jgi:hypothetical protein
MHYYTDILNMVRSLSLFKWTPAIFLTSDNDKPLTSKLYWYLTFCGVCTLGWITLTLIELGVPGVEGSFRDPDDVLTTGIIPCPEELILGPTCIAPCPNELVPMGLFNCLNIPFGAEYMHGFSGCRGFGATFGRLASACNAWADCDNPANNK